MGAGCSTEDANFFAHFLKIGGELIAPVVHPFGASLRLYRRTESRRFEDCDLLGVRFAGQSLSEMGVADAAVLCVPAARCVTVNRSRHHHRSTPLPHPRPSPNHLLAATSPPNGASRLLCHIQVPAFSLCPHRTNRASRQTQASLAPPSPSPPSPRLCHPLAHRPRWLFPPPRLPHDRAGYGRRLWRAHPPTLPRCSWALGDCTKMLGGATLQQYGGASAMHQRNACTIQRCGAAA